MSEPKFEEALARLEEIVHSLEQGEALLDEALVLFEEGVKLARFCNEKLDQAEAKIEMMMSDGQIEIVEVNEN
ncbi:MAG TPA: exodeoxyribonuclease VII small subunit [Limnochordia bacterium]|jgi:exodeoxyribonuclease VII small subunit|nr:exodeoxyribonuclease VII small subunit [Limnochordia bacterium]